MRVLLVLACLGAVLLHARYAEASLAATVKPARYCQRKSWGVCADRRYPWGSYWNNAGVSNSNQDGTYLAILGSAPSRSNVKYIAFFSSGQQGSSGGGAFENGVSGAPPNWKNGFGTGVGSKTVYLDDRSMAVEFYRSGKWPTSQTLFVSVLNSQFNHMNSASEKTDQLNGFADFLSSKVYWSNVKGVYLAGSSRGGCLVMRLSQTLRTRFSLSSNTKFIVQSFDGVCKKSQSELGTYGTKITNPLNSNYKGWATNMYGQFSSSVRANYCIRHLAGGQEVTGVALGVRTFSHYTSTGTTSSLTVNGNKWYEQKWVNLQHETIGRDYSKASQTFDPMRAHFDYCKNVFW